MNKYILIIVLLLSTIVFSQNNNQSTLTIDQIMQAEKFVGVSPSGIFWSEDSKTIYFNWNPDLELIKSLYKYELSSKKTSKVSITEEKSLINGFDF